ncbi:MAG TPA: hypothetical protein VFE23_18100 [Usitatibacter sp.]|jgi:hypothetical protein|nr:hypothetical protein [Usitatibacter sp.]
MNRMHFVVTALATATALGFTVKTLGQHESAAGAPPAAAGEATAYSADSARIPRADPDAEQPPTF